MRSCDTSRNIKNQAEDFPGGPTVENPPCNPGDTSSILVERQIHMPGSN